MNHPSFFPQIVSHTTRFLHAIFVGAVLSTWVQTYKEYQSQKVISIIETARNQYIENYIQEIALKTMVQNSLDFPQKQQIVELWYRLWKDNGDFPYDIFDQKVRETYGASQIILQSQ